MSEAPKYTPEQIVAEAQLAAHRAVDHQRLVLSKVMEIGTSALSEMIKFLNEPEYRLFARTFGEELSKMRKEGKLNGNTTARQEGSGVET